MNGGSINGDSLQMINNVIEITMIKINAITAINTIVIKIIMIKIYFIKKIFVTKINTFNSRDGKQNSMIAKYLKILAKYNAMPLCFPENVFAVGNDWPTADVGAPYFPSTA